MIQLRDIGDCKGRGYRRARSNRTDNDRVYNRLTQDNLK